MGVEETKKYEKYRTLSELSDETKIEYEKAVLPEAVHGVDVHVMITISSEEAKYGVEKEVDVTVDGVEKRIAVQVPAGMENGKYIRYREKGEAGKYGGQNGDLYVRIVVESEVKEVPVTEMEKNENIIPIHIRFLEAVKGTEKEVNLPEKTIRVKIPAGIDEGQILRLRGKDMEGGFGDIFKQFFASKTDLKNNLNQDWYVKIHIDKHPKFERKGYDIYSTEYLPFFIGAGRKVSVDTIDGKQYCNITKETKEGSQTCLKNKGIPNLKNPSIRGNHYVIWKKK